MNGNVADVTPSTLLGEVARLKTEGYRLITLSGVNTGSDQAEVLYHFDKELVPLHLRLVVSFSDVVPSISQIYFAAFLSENEIQDLFHIRFSKMVLDYDCKLFLTATTKTTPFCPDGSSKEASCAASHDQPPIPGGGE